MIAPPASGADERHARQTRYAFLLPVALASGAAGASIVACLNGSGSHVHAWHPPSFLSTAALTVTAVALALRTGPVAPASVVLLSMVAGVLNVPACILVDSLVYGTTGALDAIVMLTLVAGPLAAALGLGFGLLLAVPTWAVADAIEQRSPDATRRARMAGGALLVAAAVASVLVWPPVERSAVVLAIGGALGLVGVLALAHAALGMATLRRTPDGTTAVADLGSSRRTEPGRGRRIPG